MPLAGFRIPKPWIPDSTDQNYLDSGFRIPDYLIWAHTEKYFKPTSRFPTISRPLWSSRFMGKMKVQDSFNILVFNERPRKWNIPQDKPGSNFSKCQVSVKYLLFTGRNASRDFYIVTALFVGAIFVHQYCFASIWSLNQQERLGFNSMKRLSLHSWTGIKSKSTSLKTWND